MAGAVFVIGIAAVVVMTRPASEPVAAATTRVTTTTTSRTLPPTTTTPSTTTTTTLPTTLPPTTTTGTAPATTLRPKPPYLPVEIAYFEEIAGRSEFGDEGSGIVHRWETDLLIEVHGTPTEADLAALEALLGDLNAILDPIEVRVVASDGTVDLHFAPEGEFPAIEPNYRPGNSGYVYIWWNGRGEIVRARVLISTEVAPRFRSHLLREEITQSLGLLNDSWEYEASIFYQGWTSTQTYARIDMTVIEMLYRPELWAGMEIEDAVAILRGLGDG